MKDKNINPEESTLDSNNFLFCPTKNCINIPSISYTYNPLGSNIQYNCNCNKNINIIQNNNISEFLETVSNIKCAECNSIITKNDIYYCKQCKKLFDYSCLVGHIFDSNHEVIPVEKHILFNNCLDHCNPFIVYCEECNKSLCSICNFDYHKNQGHNLIKISDTLNNKNSEKRIYSTFQKQKRFLEKIKKINENIIKSLENDLIIKEKIIENYKNNKNNYQSILNYNKLYIENDDKFEKLMDYIINKEEETGDNENKNIVKGTFLNRILCPFYYSLMINKDQILNGDLLNLLENSINKINEKRRTNKKENNENNDNNDKKENNENKDNDDNNENNENNDNNDSNDNNYSNKNKIKERNLNNENNVNKLISIKNLTKNNDIKIINNNIDYCNDKKENKQKNKDINNNYNNFENNKKNSNNFNISFDCSKIFYNISHDNNQNENIFKGKINISNDNNINGQENWNFIEDCLKNDFKNINNINNNNIINNKKNTNFYQYDPNKNNNNRKNFLHILNKKLPDKVPIIDNTIFDNNFNKSNNKNKSKDNKKNNFIDTGSYNINNINDNLKTANINNNVKISNNNSDNIDNVNNIPNKNILLSNGKNNVLNENSNDNSLNNSKNSSSITQTDNLNSSINKSLIHKNSNQIENSFENYKKRKKSKKVDYNEDNEISSNNFNYQKEKEGISKNKINNPIFNMILLYTGNFAISMKEAIEIYDFRKLNLNGNCSITYNNSQIRENNCLLQRINLIKGKKINYVFEFPDKTLFCGTYSKLFRLRLTNNDLSHNIIGIIRLTNSELPTQLISLGESFLVILSEIRTNCNLKIYKKKEIINDNINASQSLDGNEKNLSDKDFSSNENDDYSDVAPPIGNSLFEKKNLDIDKSFQLFKNNINKERKLFLSIYEIKKKDINNNSDYIYEFIATSNQIYNYGDNRIEFYGAHKVGYNNIDFNRITVIKNISCSIQVNSICQLNDKYLCVGLQNHDLEGQISGFAIIDIYTREISRIIRDHEISCLYYSTENNLLIASMEVRDIKSNYFMNKIYKVINNIGDKGKEEIDLQKIYEYKNGHKDTVSSIFELKPFCFRVNIEKDKINENIILATSSHDSNLEVIKTNIKK